MSRKVCVVTGTRAEFGLLRWLMHEIKSAPEFELQVLVTGMHLSPEFGQTFREIEEAGFSIDEKVEMLLSADTSTAITKSMGLGMIGFADAYDRLDPELVVVLGDRFEIFAASAAALIAGVPIAHISGGERTEGAFDEALRHSITKMSNLHFTAAEVYRQRVVQLGEQPVKVFNVGGLGIDAIRRLELLNRDALEQSLNFKFGNRNLLITFHPVTLEGKTSSEQQMAALLEALGELKSTHMIFTMPNADTGGRDLMAMVNKFSEARKNVAVFTSLGQTRYLSCMKYVDAVVGNSSSGLAEAPSMGIATVNIGDRQRGRLLASSVISCDSTRHSISEALCTVFEASFQESLKSVDNPYGNGGASKRIVEVLQNQRFDGLLKKSFFDLSFPMQGASKNA